MSKQRDRAFFLGLMATALAMGAALAHALELTSKMRLGQADYFVVQQIYAGWDLLAILLVIELGSMIWLAMLYRGDRRVLYAVLYAIAALVAAQAVFWIWTFPANTATRNWTVQPDTWHQLRQQWEFSHLAGAGFQLLAFGALVVAVLRRKD